jgi:hypothetical protein
MDQVAPLGDLSTRLVLYPGGPLSRWRRAATLGEIDNQPFYDRLSGDRQGASGLAATAQRT